MAHNCPSALFSCGPLPETAIKVGRNSHRKREENAAKVTLGLLINSMLPACLQILLLAQGNPQTMNWYSLHLLNTATLAKPHSSIVHPCTICVVNGSTKSRVAIVQKELLKEAATYLAGCGVG